MEFNYLIDNLTNPALLFFFLGLFAVRVKSDLEIPANSSKFISLYLLFSIGFKGGQELSHSHPDMEIAWSLLAGILLALVVPAYTFFFLRKRLGTPNAGAIAAAYGSVSAVTFVTAVSFLEQHNVFYSGHMVAVMAMMEAPSIIIGVLLMQWFRESGQPAMKCGPILRHSITNGSVLLILGSLVIGYMANEEQAMGIQPFTTDLFKGFLAVFLLDMGITSGRKIASLVDSGWFPFVFSVLIPLVNGVIVSIASGAITSHNGNQFLFGILAASASYIAVPAAMRMAAPEANPGLYIPMALAITFPFNITLGMPLYYYLSEIY